jgi:hypothetical protein
MFELDFLPVGNSNGDAICMQYGVSTGVYVHVVDGAYAETGERSSITFSSTTGATSL